MGDDRQGRDKQAHDAEQRQRERELAEALERRDEPEPPVDTSDLAFFVDELDTVSFPATGADIVATLGEETLETPEQTYTVADVLPDTDTERFDSPERVRQRIERPTVAMAMKTVVEACAAEPHVDLDGSQKTAYEKTFRALRAIDADDEDEGIQVITDWIVGRIREKQSLPGSRAVRREAARFCRQSGYQVDVDEWLGI